MMHYLARATIALCLGLLLVGCSSEAPAAQAPAQHVLSPTVAVTAAPTALPTAAPTALPTVVPTALPTVVPTAVPTMLPTVVPSATPTAVPPSATPKPKPTAKPTAKPAPPTAVPAAPTAQQEPALPASATYMFPVQSSGKISYGQYHHDYPATDIFCPIGSSFVAPTSGVVDWISTEDTWDPATDDPAVRGGRSVAIVGDDGVRYYGSHLSAIAEGLAVGQHVAIGQVLGRTGNSGDARFTQPHLHFGISRPTTPDDWQARRGQISPYPYLRAWQRGEQRKPAV